MAETYRNIDDIKNLLKVVPDFPKPGIQFLDISPVLRTPGAFRVLIQELERSIDFEFDKIAAIESRGFLLGSALAYNYHKGLVLVRKKGKLPGQTVAHTYELEYGTDTREMTEDAIKPGDRVLIVDDVLATGGTAQATQTLVEKVGGEVLGHRFFIEIAPLHGRERLKNNIHSLIIEGA